MATEEPKFEIIAQDQDIELRRYPTIIVAEVTVTGDMDAASGQGFRAIADYIFGNNVAVNPSPTEAAEKIAMTAPVILAPSPTTSPTALASDSPALQGAKHWQLHFVMPSRYTLETLPKPNNPAVVIRPVSAKTWAVLKYSGFNTEAGIQKRIDELRIWVLRQNLTAVGSPHLARYNPPWTLPMLRRNEVMLEIE